MRLRAASQAGSAPSYCGPSSQKFFSNRLAAWAGASAASDNTTAAAKPFRPHDAHDMPKLLQKRADFITALRAGERFDSQIRSRRDSRLDARLGMLPPANRAGLHAVCVRANIKPEAGGVERPSRAVSVAAVSSRRFCGFPAFA